MFQVKVVVLTDTYTLCPVAIVYTLNRFWEVCMFKINLGSCEVGITINRCPKTLIHPTISCMKRPIPNVTNSNSSKSIRDETYALTSSLCFQFMLLCTTTTYSDVFNQLHYCYSSSLALQPRVGPWPPLRVSWQYVYYDVGYQPHDQPCYSHPDSTTIHI
jgi:hypothetical protein